MWLSVSKTGGVVCVTTGAVWKLQWQRLPPVSGNWHGNSMQPGDVVVADSAYGTYVDLALVHSANADAVFRKHHARHCDFRRGKLGIGDHIVAASWDVLNQCLQKTLSITSKHRSAGVHLLIQRPGFDPPKSFWSPL